MAGGGPAGAAAADPGKGQWSSRGQQEPLGSRSSIPRRLLRLPDLLSCPEPRRPRHCPGVRACPPRAARQTHPEQPGARSSAPAGGSAELPVPFHLHVGFRSDPRPAARPPATAHNSSLFQVVAGSFSRKHLRVIHSLNFFLFFLLNRALWARRRSTLPCVLCGLKINPVYF